MAEALPLTCDYCPFFQLHYLSQDIEFRLPPNFELPPNWKPTDKKKKKKGKKKDQGVNPRAKKKKNPNPIPNPNSNPNSNPNKAKKLATIKTNLIKLLGIEGENTYSIPEAVQKLLEKGYFNGEDKLVIFIPDYYLESSKVMPIK